MSAGVAYTESEPLKRKRDISEPENDSDCEEKTAEQ
jgi:hypothetical protein